MREPKMFEKLDAARLDYFSTRDNKVMQRKIRNMTALTSNIISTFDKEAKIVDAGCGGNQYQMHFPNLIAFDPVDYGNQHFVSSILDADIDQESQDGVLCLGVLHECPDDYIQANMEKMLSWIKPGGKLVMKHKATPLTYKINHPYIDTLKAQGMWDKEKIDEYTNMYNLKLNWIEPWRVTRQQQKKHTKVNPLELVIDGFIWCWEKNETI